MPSCLNSQVSFTDIYRGVFSTCPRAHFEWLRKVEVVMRQSAKIIQLFLTIGYSILDKIKILDVRFALI